MGWRPGTGDRPGGVCTGPLPDAEFRLLSSCCMLHRRLCSTARSLSPVATPPRPVRLPSLCQEPAKPHTGGVSSPAACCEQAFPPSLSSTGEEGSTTRSGRCSAVRRRSPGAKTGAPTPVCYALSSAIIWISAPSNSCTSLR